MSASAKGLAALVAVSLVTISLWAQDSGPFKGGLKAATSSPASGPSSHPSSKSHPMIEGKAATKLTDEQEQALLAFCKTWNPIAYERMMKLKDVDPSSYADMARGWHAWMEQVNKMPEKYRQAYLIQQSAYSKIWTIIGQTHVAMPTQSPELNSELRQAVTALFDAELLVREYRLVQLEEQLKALRSDLDASRDKREELIQKRLDEYNKQMPAASQPKTSTRQTAEE